MDRFAPSIVFSDFYGSAGDVTAYHLEDKCHIRKRSCPQFPQTEAQSARLAVHRRALEAWRTLPHEVQQLWNSYAIEAEPHKPPFDHSSHISGNNLFVSAYHGFAALGNEHIPEPMPWADFPVFSPELLSCEEIDGCLLLKFNVNIKYIGNKAYRLHLRIQLTNQCAGHNPGKMRTFIADRDCTADEDTATISILDYRSLWQVQSDSLDAHCRFTLTDTRTGYRSQYQKRKLENIFISEAITE